MLLQEFEPNFKLVGNRFNKKLTPELIELYYSRLKKIPAAAFKQIAEKIIDDSKYFPSPGELKRCWYDWLNDHPQHKVNRQYLPCDYCNGEGALTVRMLIQSPMGKGMAEYDSLSRCGHCENWKEAGLPPDIPIVTVEQIAQLGHKWVVAGVVVDDENPWPPKYLKRKKQKSVNETVEDIANQCAMPQKQKREERIAKLRQQGQQIQDDIPF